MAHDAWDIDIDTLQQYGGAVAGGLSGFFISSLFNYLAVENPYVKAISIGLSLFSGAAAGYYMATPIETRDERTSRRMKQESAWTTSDKPEDVGKRIKRVKKIITEYHHGKIDKELCDGLLNGYNFEDLVKTHPRLLDLYRLVSNQHTPVSAVSLFSSITNLLHPQDSAQQSIAHTNPYTKNGRTSA